MKARNRLTLQTGLVAIIVIVALVYGLFIRPNYYTFNGGEIFFEPIFSEYFTNSYQLYTYENSLYIGTENGLKKTTLDGVNIWDKTFYVENPVLYTEGKYMAVVNATGKEAYIFDDNGVLAQITVEYPILFGELSKEGALALVLEKEDMHLTQLYNRKGILVAERGTHFIKDGYPVAVALSSTGEKMVTSYLIVNQGKMQSTITAFSFGEAGENDPENILGGFMQEGVFSSEIRFLDDEHFAVIGDRMLSFYSIKDTPVLETQIEINNEIQSIAYSGQNVILYFGKMLDVTSGSLESQIAVYSKEGEELDVFTPENQVVKLFGDDDGYFILTNASLEYHNMDKLIWRYETGKEIQGVMKIEKEKYIISYKQGFEIVKMKGI